MPINEQQVDEMIQAVKNGDLSIWKKNPRNVGVVNLLAKLSALPKARIARFDSVRIRSQILDRISVPTEVLEKAGWSGKFASFVPYLKMGVGVMASFVIVVSLAVGVAVTALDSVPGSAVYPLKKIVENIQLKLAPNDQQANLQLKFADNRADELQQVLQNNQDGKISDQETQAIVANTVKDLQKTASAAVTSTSTKSVAKSTSIVNKLADIGNKLKAASVQSEGVVKIELEKAIQSTQDSQDEAIKNLEQAGLKVDAVATPADDSVHASGKLTAVSETTLSIGTAKFLLTADTKFVGIVTKDLKVDVVVDITGKIKDNKTYAVTVTLVTETKTQSPTPTTTPDTTPETP